MQVSGLLLTLAHDEALAARALAAIECRPDLLPGGLHEHWLPVAMEAADDAASRATHDWLQALPGVEFVDVVSVHFEPA